MRFDTRDARPVIIKHEKQKKQNVDYVKNVAKNLKKTYGGCLSLCPGENDINEIVGIRNGLNFLEIVENHTTLPFLLYLRAFT